MSLARAIITGTVISEPEKRFTATNVAVTNFTIQVTPTGRDTPYTVRITCWRALADVITDRIHKDDVVTVEGRLQVNQFEGQGGITRRTYEIDASNVYLGHLQPLAPQFEGQSGGNRPAAAPNASYAPPGQPAATQPQPSAMAGVGTPMASGPASGTFSQDDLLTEDDIPF